MKALNCLPVALLCSLACAGGTEESRVVEAEGEWISLFNGEDLTGWDVKIAGYPLNENYASTFRVEEGLLRVSYDGYPRFDGEFGHLFYREKLSDYVLRLEYRFVGEQAPGGPEWALRNSGVMLHSQSAASMGQAQEFPVSVEAQFLGGTGEVERRPTLNLCTPGTHVLIDDELVTEHCIDSTSPTFHGDDWVTAEIIVQGDRLLRHRVEGAIVMTYSKPRIGGEHLPEDFPLAEGTPLAAGYIALQAESHPIDFRRIELMKLEPGAAFDPDLLDRSTP